MEVTQDITTAKTAVHTDWNRQGPELVISNGPTSIVLCFSDEGTMRRFGHAVNALCPDTENVGRIKLSNNKRITEPTP